MDISDKFIIVAGHVTEAYGPVQAVKNYLAKKTDDLLYITHPFTYSKLEGSAAEFYIKGKQDRVHRAHKRGKSQFIQWIKDILFNIGFIRKQKKKAGLFVALNNLNALSGIILKKTGRVEKVAYYIIDHTARRFKNPLFNFIYENVDKWALKGSDYVWILSERMAEAKKKKFRFDHSKIIIVPVGMELDKIDRYTREEKLSKKTMILMGMLDKTKGVQLMIEAMGDIVNEVPGAKLLIIGTGPYEGELKKLAQGMESIEFTGAMEHDEVFRFIPHHRIGLAPYMDDPNSYTYYADPTKPKEYLGCGLPLIITDVPWIAEEVKKRPMGIVCRYVKEELVKSCIKLLDDDEFYGECLKNSEEFASGLSWDKIYDETLKKMEN